MHSRAHVPVPLFGRADKKWVPSLCAHVISYWLNTLHGINQENPLRSKTGKWLTGLKPPLFVCLVFLLSRSGTFLFLTSEVEHSSFLSPPPPSVKSTQWPQALLLLAFLHRWLRWTGKSWPLSCQSSSTPPSLLFFFSSSFLARDDLGESLRWQEPETYPWTERKALWWLLISQGH